METIRVTNAAKSSKTFEFDKELVEGAVLLAESELVLFSSLSLIRVCI